MREEKKKLPLPSSFAIYAAIAPFSSSLNPAEPTISASRSQCGKKQGGSVALRRVPGASMSRFAKGLAFFLFPSVFLSLRSLSLFLVKKSERKQKHTCQHLLGKEPGLRAGSLQRRRRHHIRADVCRSVGRGGRRRVRRGARGSSRGRCRRRWRNALSRRFPARRGDRSCDHHAAPRRERRCGGGLPARRGHGREAAVRARPRERRHLGSR